MHVVLDTVVIDAVSTTPTKIMFLWYPSVVVYCSLDHTAVLTVISDSYIIIPIHMYYFLFSSSFAVDQEIATQCTSRHHYLCRHYELINFYSHVCSAE